MSQFYIGVDIWWRPGVALKLYEVVRITIGMGIALHPAYALQADQ